MKVIIKSDNYQQLKKDLNLYFDQENIRCWGRLKNAPLNTRIFNISSGAHITYFSAVVVKKRKNFE